MFERFSNDPRTTAERPLNNPRTTSEQPPNDPIGQDFHANYSEGLLSFAALLTENGRMTEWPNSTTAEQLNGRTRPYSWTAVYGQADVQL